MKRLLIIAILAAATSSTTMASIPRNAEPPRADAMSISRYLKVTRGYGNCVFRCVDRRKQCLANAADEAARRECRLAAADCENNCNRFQSQW